MSDTPRSAEGNEAKTIALKQKRAMEIAYAPGKNLFMTGFMLWMSGAGVHIFSIMMTAMAMFQPIRGMMSVNMTFKGVEGKGVDLMIPKLTFVAMNCLGLGLGLWKCSMMGLLPVHAADWTHYIPMREDVEMSMAGGP